MRFPEFERAEFEGRWERARALMAQAGLDALLIASEQNLRYLSGLVTPFWVSKSRPLFLLLPLRRDPVLVVTTNQVETARATSWVEDVRAWEGLAAPGVDLLAETIREQGLDRGRIGAELGYEQRLNLPFAEFVRLQALLPGAAFVDAADLLWTLRLIKSPAEIDYLRRSNQITDAAYREAFAALRAGMTEWEVYATFAASVIRQGAERPGYLPMNAGAGNYQRFATWPTERPLQPGDMFWMDGGCLYRGYWTDVARMAAIGTATDEQRRLYRIARAALYEGMRAAHPGLAVAELARMAMRAFEEAGIPFSSQTRIGHGIGLDITEPPSIAPGDPTIIQAGMVLTLEPSSLTDFGFFQLEENFVVTPDGVEQLSEPAPEELPIINADPREKP